MMNIKNSWRLLAILALFLIGLSLLPLSASAFNEKLDWTVFASAYITFGIYFPLIFR
jgi:hypothetical protein